jgi:hypothetical protein
MSYENGLDYKNEPRLTIDEIAEKNGKIFHTFSELGKRLAKSPEFANYILPEGFSPGNGPGKKK